MTPDWLNETVRAFGRQIGLGAFGGSSIFSIALPDKIEQIPDGTFWRCSYRESIELPDSIKTIGARAFRCCAKLKEIKLPSSLETIGEDAFHSCSSLVKITLPKSLVELASSAFGNCESLSEINVEEGSEFFSARDGVLLAKRERELVFYPAGRTESAYVVPETVMTIAENAFLESRSLKHLVLPRSLREIKSNAINRDLSLRVYEDSYAHKWARRHGRTFSIIG